MMVISMMLKIVLAFFTFCFFISIVGCDNVSLPEKTTQDTLNVAQAIKKTSRLKHQGHASKQRKYFDMADVVLEDALQKNPDNPLLLLALVGQLLSSTNYITDQKRIDKRYLRAKNIALKLLKQEPTHARAYLHLAHIETHAYRIGQKPNIEKVKESLENAYKYTAEDDSVLLSQIGQQAFTSGLFDECEKYLLQALKVTKENDIHSQVKQINRVLGEIYIIKGKVTLAEKYLEKSKFDKKGSGWGCAFQSLGALYRQMGLKNKALEHFKKTADLNPNNDIDNYLAAIMCLHSSEFNDAQKYIDQAISITDFGYYHIFKGYIFLFL